MTSLAAEAISECQDATVPLDLQRTTAESLLSLYAEAQEVRQFPLCAEIERVYCKWLGSSNETMPMPAITLSNALKLQLGTSVQRATLTLLAMTAQEIDQWPALVCDQLIPPLLSIAQLPGIADYEPDVQIGQVAQLDLTLADLSLCVLTFMGKSGPAGLMVPEVGDLFNRHPELLTLLARYSLESATLITPVIIPTDPENTEVFEVAVQRWIDLGKSVDREHIYAHQIEECRDIHLSLLNSAEEVCYPGVILLLEMLRDSVQHRTEPWPQIWKAYLLNQVGTVSYPRYVEGMLLHSTLFPELTSQEEVVARIQADYFHEGPKQRYAEHFIALLGNDVTEPIELRDIDEIRYIRYLRDLSYRRVLRDISVTPTSKRLKYLSYLRYLRSMEHMKFLAFMRYQGYLRHMLLTQENVAVALDRMANVSGPRADDLFTIVVARMLHLREMRGKPADRRQSLRHLTTAIKASIARTSTDNEVRTKLELLLSRTHLISRGDKDGAA
jgi:hypothetical protein